MDHHHQAHLHQEQARHYAEAQADQRTSSDGELGLAGLEGSNVHVRCANEMVSGTLTSYNLEPPHERQTYAFGPSSRQAAEEQF